MNDVSHFSSLILDDSCNLCDITGTCFEFREYLSNVNVHINHLGDTVKMQILVRQV